MRFARETMPLVALTALATPAAAEESYTGLWGFGGCGDFQNLEYQGHTTAVFSRAAGIEVIEQVIDPVEKGQWFFVRTGPDDPAPGLMRRDGDALLYAWPEDEPSDAEALSALHDKLRTGALDPDTDPDAFDIDRAVSCPGLPLPQSLVFGEALNVLSEFDSAVWSCGNEVGNCADRLFGVVDVSGNGELSVAEMARLVRSVTLIGMALQGETTSEQASAAGASAAALAPIAAASFLHSFDYDRSGGLSFDEILGERLPGAFRVEEDLDFNIDSVVSAISDRARQAAGVGAMLLR